MLTGLKTFFGTGLLAVGLVAVYDYQHWANVWQLTNKNSNGKDR